MFEPNELYQDYMKENAYLIRWIKGIIVIHKYICTVKCQYYILRQMKSQKNMMDKLNYEETGRI